MKTQAQTLPSLSVTLPGFLRVILRKAGQNIELRRQSAVQAQIQMEPGFVEEFGLPTPKPLQAIEQLALMTPAVLAATAVSAGRRGHR